MPTEPGYICDKCFSKFPTMDRFTVSLRRFKNVVEQIEPRPAYEKTFYLCKTCYVDILGFITTRKENAWEPEASNPAGRT